MKWNASKVGSLESPEIETRRHAGQPARRGLTGLGRFLPRLGHLAGELRDDEQGSTTLMAAMMVFLVTIFTVIALNTNKVIYQRMRAQNAADAAADAAALWQARGCNVLQHLNNLHYTVDVTATTLENISGGACMAAAVFQGMIESGVPPLVAVGSAGRPVACPICEPLPAIDAAQQFFYKAIKPIRELVVVATPPIAFAAANASAKGAGADGVVEVITQTFTQMANSLGFTSPVPDFTGGVRGVEGFFYALPLDPTSLFLHVREKQGEGKPWSFPKNFGSLAEKAGNFGCSDLGFPTAITTAVSSGWDHKWGWHDTYAFGNPGYMTWVAGKASASELLGMGDLRWFNGKTIDAEEASKMYTVKPPGEDKLRIPAILGFASSQVEGRPVVSHGDANARGKLIKVYFPGEKEGEKVWIWH
jgi:hypothetical protein